ncbi:DNA polymerase IV [Corynebacterium variabile]|uniref:DNA polymerase IV n=1 Tax=Corynebacterium variabile TaxID=1727 RepID=UPI0028962CA7|nr:DNA polymerase IV [Corynebacterium variabile]
MTGSGTGERRWVVHVDMDAFFASVEQLTRPTLRGRPVLVGGASGRGVVAGASYEARVFGARSAMPMSQAVRLCRGKASVVHPRFVVYSAASERIFGILEREAGFIERLSVDEGFAEPAVLVGATTQDAGSWAHALQDTVEQETGLVCSIGVSTGKLHAKMASDLNKPHGVAVVGADRRDEVFGPRPVGEIGGIGPVAQARLAEVGVTTIGQFTAMDDADVRSLLGSVGTQLLGYARGVDPRPVAARGRAKQVSAERTLEVDAATTAAADPVLVASATAAHSRLKKDGRAARTVTVKTRTADFRAHTRSLTLAVPTEDLDEIIAASRSVMPHPEESGAVRLVGVSLSGLTEERQGALFPELSEIGTRETVHPDLPKPEGAAATDPRGPWRATQDVRHAEFGHGWVQGTGGGVVSVRFETRATGPGRTRTFPVDDPDLSPADPLESLAWDPPAVPPTDTAVPSGPEQG